MRANFIRRVLGAGALFLLLTAGDGFGQRPAQATTDLSSARLVAEELLAGQGTLCDVALLHVRDSVASIVASVDTSGRQFCNQLVVIRGGTRPSILQALDTWWLSDLESSVDDLDGDSTDEIIIPQAISDYEGSGACIATVPIVHRCANGGCANAATQFAAFYLQESEKLKGELLAEQQGRRVDGADVAPCLQMEIAHIARILGTDPRAGFDLAERWMKDPDPFLRRKAAAILSEFDDTTATDRIVALTKDTDPVVAATARVKLSNRKR